MKLNKVNVSYSRTVQMRQFEPAIVYMSLEAQIDPTDNPTTVIEDVKRKVKKHVEAEVTQLMKDRKASFDDELEKTI